MSSRPINVAWRDGVIARRIHEARRGRVRTDRDDRPHPEQIVFTHRERVRGDADAEHDAEPAISVPSIDDERAASRASAAEARRLFDRMFDLVQQQATPHGETTAGAVN